MFDWLKNKKKNKFACTDNSDCFIAFSCTKEGELSYDFGFHDDTLEQFTNMFALIHTGILHEDMGNSIMQFLISNGKKEVAEEFMEMCHEKIGEITEDLNDDDDDDPVISPINVFRDQQKEEDEDDDE